MKKRLVSVLLALVIIVSIASVMAVPASAATPPANYSPGNYVVTATELNVRQTAGATTGNNSTLKSAYNGYRLVISEVKDVSGTWWGKISKYSTGKNVAPNTPISTAAWVSLNYTGRYGVATTTKLGSIKALEDSSQTYLRSGAGTSFGKLSVLDTTGLKVGQAVYVYTAYPRGNWYLVLVKDKNGNENKWGYIDRKYLSF